MNEVHIRIVISALNRTLPNGRILVKLAFFFFQQNIVIRWQLRVFFQLEHGSLGIMARLPLFEWRILIKYQRSLECK